MIAGRRLLFLIAQLVTLTSFLLFSGIHNAQSQEAQKQWHWFSAISLQDDWSVMKGVADVVIKKHRIDAELYDSKGGLRMSITGTIKKGHIKVNVTRHGTDDPPRELTGPINKFEEGRSSILLIDKYAGGIVVGITVN